MKVVDKTAAHGRILAAVDKVRPQRVDDVAVGHQSLLYVEFEDLGNKVWQLDLDGDWPVLRLNQNVDGIALVAGSEARFLALVYPEIYRQILTRILIADGTYSIQEPLILDSRDGNTTWEAAPGALGI